MIRTMIKIDEEKCNGCSLCVTACHEGAIAMIDGKAKLIRDDYCDGLGNCLPVCPTGALSFEEREAAPFDEEAVKRHLAEKEATVTKEAEEPAHHSQHQGGGCPGSQARLLHGHGAMGQGLGRCPGSNAHSIHREASAPSSAPGSEESSQLMQWPVQIKLVPLQAPYFQHAKLLIAADCAAYAYSQFHSKFMKNKVTIIGCPKLDEGDYSEKLTEILRHNDIKSITLVRMEVPCCGGLEHALKKTLQNSGKMIPWQIHVISTHGGILED